MSYFHGVKAVSDGICHAPRGESEMSVTSGPSVMTLRLNCCVKKRFRNTSRVEAIFFSVKIPLKAWQARV